MSTDTIPTRINSQTIDQTWFNVIQQVLGGDLVPRNVTGAPTNEAGTLGESGLAWLRAYIQSGYFSLGDIKVHHSYNGAAPIGEGWMLCDGRQITQANYDTEHGSGHWSTYVASSPLLNKYLPNMTGRYPVGVAATVATGASAIPTIGNGGNTVNLSHSHTVNSHTHQWYNVQGGNANDQTFNSGGSAFDIQTVGWASGTDTPHGIVLGLAANNATGQKFGTNNYTAGSAPGTSTALSISQSIQPDSIAVQYYMRII